MIRARAFLVLAFALALAQIPSAGFVLSQTDEPPAPLQTGPAAPRPARSKLPRAAAPATDRPRPAEPLQIVAQTQLARGLDLEQLPAFLMRRATKLQGVAAAPAQPVSAPEPEPEQGLRPVGLPDPSGGALAQAWCASIVDPAQEARAAWQAKKIAELEGRLEAQIIRLEAKRKEYLEWFDRQEEQRRKAEDSVVSIVSRMRPDAAAAQLAVMDEASAAAVLSRMNPRTASVILNEMTAAKAARIADVISSVTQAKAKAAQGASK